MDAPAALDYEIVDVFAPRPFTGNQLAVVLDADGLTTGQCQALANEFNLSETAFLSAPREGGDPLDPTGGPPADYRVRIFTPNVELPFAGHPSVGRPPESRAPAPSTTTSSTPAPHSWRSVPAGSRPVRTSVWAAPTLGWPAKGSSTFGVKIRTR